MRWARSPAALEGADWVILPGSKHTSGDLAWMRTQGFDRAVRDHASTGKPVLGICGGLQMLGTRLRDPHGVDGQADGLGLLPLVTEFKRAKTVRRRHVRFASLAGPWAVLSGLAVQGYEIHQGQTSTQASTVVARPVMPENLAWQNEQGNILGLYLHGLFENSSALEAFFGATVPSFDKVFDGLADFIDQHFQAGVLAALVA